MKKYLFLTLFLLLPAYTQAIQILHTEDRKSLKAELITQLQEAKDSILVFTFTFSDPDLLQILDQKAKDGLDVSVVIDKDHMQPLQAIHNPQITLITRQTGEGRIHHKILVIDNRHIWIGSLNFTDSACTHQENVMLSFDCPQLAAILEKEKEAFLGTHARSHLETNEFLVDSKALFFGLLPHDGFPAKREETLINKTSKNRLLDAIGQAKTRIQIAMMVWTDQELTRAICAAHQRGVLVEVVSQDFGGEIPILQKAGIHVIANTKSSLMHNKCMIIDESIFMNGSANWSKSSFTRNDESFVILYALDEEQRLLLQQYWNYLKMGN